MIKSILPLIAIASLSNLAMGASLNDYVTIQSADRYVDTNGVGIIANQGVTPSDSDSASYTGRFTTSASIYSYNAPSRQEALYLRSQVNHNGNLTIDTFGAELYTVSAAYVLGAGNVGTIQSDNVFDVAFDLSQRVRYSATYSFRSVKQGSSAFASSDLLLTDSTGVVMSGYVNEVTYTGASSAKGWLEAGSAQLTVEQMADATSLLGSEGANTSGSFLVRLFCPADTELDGDVDALDQSFFNVLFADQDPLADMDGDGDVDSQDQSLYAIAFASGC